MEVNYEYKGETLSKLAFRTRLWIAEALFEMMKHEKYSLISIKEITEKADVSRQSFYRHFTTKEDIVAFYLDVYVVKPFKQLLDASPVKGINESLVLYFEFWHSHREIFEVISESDYPMHALTNYELLMKAHFTASLSLFFEDYSVQDEIGKAVITDFLIGGLFNVKRNWAANGYIQSPEQLTQILKSFIWREKC